MMPDDRLLCPIICGGIHCCYIVRCLPTTLPATAYPALLCLYYVTYLCDCVIITPYDCRPAIRSSVTFICYWCYLRMGKNYHWLLRRHTIVLWKLIAIWEHTPAWRSIYHWFCDDIRYTYGYSTTLYWYWPRKPRYYLTGDCYYCCHIVVLTCMYSVLLMPVMLLVTEIVMSIHWYFGDVNALIIEGHQYLWLWYSNWANWQYYYHSPTCWCCYWIYTLVVVFPC